MKNSNTTKDNVNLEEVYYNIQTTESLRLLIMERQVTMAQELKSLSQKDMFMIKRNSLNYLMITKSETVQNKV